MTSLEQVRSIFDKGATDVVLIGTPGIEKRMARLPQFNSRIGFVHEFRPLAQLNFIAYFTQDGVHRTLLFRQDPRKPEVLAAIVRMTSGNFRLVNRLLTKFSVCSR